ncbi:MAG: DUF2321 domain-containing protein [Candidatus Marinimicrobia bacterium]|nr:DUF2321 domain-containing protein [Candidatus Neomarinimicrobiota bacterium]
MLNRIDIAQICINGHIITDSYRPSSSNQNFCDNCGETLITNCKNCDAPIRGKEWIPDIMADRPVGLYRPKSFCYNCGKPFPWTEAVLVSAKELAMFSDAYSEDEKKVLSQSIDEIIIDTPKTKVEAVKFSHLMKKGGRAIADGFREILIDVISETAKKIIWPNE